jgi:hypothetical protein
MMDVLLTRVKRVRCYVLGARGMLGSGNVTLPLAIETPAAVCTTTVIDVPTKYAGAIGTMASWRRARRGRAACRPAFPRRERLARRSPQKR